MDWKLDANGDKAVENGDFVMIDGVDEIVQFLSQSLRFIQQEWFLDETLGFPWFDDVFVKNPDLNAITAIFKTYIINIPGILELTQFDLDYDPNARTLTITGNFISIDGDADFTVVIPAPGGGS